MIFKSIGVLYALLAFTLIGCNHQSRIVPEGDTEDSNQEESLGEQRDESDQAGDTSEHQESPFDFNTPMNPDRVANPEEISDPTGAVLKIWIHPSQGEIRGRLQRVSLLDTEGEPLQIYRPGLTIDTRRKTDGFGLSDPVSEFSSVDLWLDMPEFMGRGGGDLSGLVMPHLVIERNAPWSTVVILMTVPAGPPPKSAQERRAFVEQWVASVRVENDKGEIVGLGSVERTTWANARWPAVVTGQTRCFSLTEETPCAHDGQDAESARDWTPFVALEHTLLDPVTGLQWENPPLGCLEGEGCLIEQAHAHCESIGMRVPQLVELRTIMHFDRAPAFRAEISLPTRERLWSSNTRQTVDGLSFSTIMVGSGRVVNLLDDAPWRNGVICAGGALFDDHEPLYPLNVDTTAGMMWLPLDTDMTWSEALAACEQAVQLEYRDWRLPNLAELTLWQHLRDPPRDDAAWSSTTLRESPTKAWIADWAGWADANKDELRSVRCLRSIP